MWLGTEEDTPGAAASPKEWRFKGAQCVWGVTEGSESLTPHMQMGRQISTGPPSKVSQPSAPGAASGLLVSDLRLRACNSILPGTLSQGVKRDLEIQNQRQVALPEKAVPPLHLTTHTSISEDLRCKLPADSPTTKKLLLGLFQRWGLNQAVCATLGLGSVL